MPDGGLAAGCRRAILGQINQDKCRSFRSDNLSRRNSFGNRLSESDFDANGNAIASSNPAAVDHLFGYIMEESGTAMWTYSTIAPVGMIPVQGRWISQDPIGFEAGDANLYRYVGNA